MKRLLLIAYIVVTGWGCAAWEYGLWSDGAHPVPTWSLWDAPVYWMIGAIGAAIATLCMPLMAFVFGILIFAEDL